MRSIATVALAFVLAGCSAFDYQAASDRAARRAETNCRSIGLTPASEKWQDCLIRMMAAEKGAANVGRPAKGNSFMCKDAMARGDGGAIRVFC